MKQFFLLTAFLFFTCLSFAQTRNLKLVPTENPVVNQTRKAVVIGMSAYGGANTLDNTLNDANDMAEVLRKLGFEVTLLENDDLQSLRINLNNWYNSIEGNDMAVFYYAGHGMSDSHGKNYLIPIGANLLSEADLETYTLSITNVLNNMDAKNVKMKLLILDACRSNEFSRSWNRGEGNKGLSAISAEGTYIAFATAPNSTALDGGNYGLHNGIFTYYLLQEIVKPGLTISKIFDDVAKNVNQRTDKKQSPFRTNGLSDDFYFIPGTPGDNPVPYNPSPAPIPNNSPAPVTDVAELLRQADAFYNNKQYDKAVPLYKQAADQGNADAQNKLGVYYLNGWVLTKEKKNTTEPLLGDSIGKALFAILAQNLNLNQTAKDYNQAIYWFRKAADQGNADAQNNLGDCYRNGWGVAKDKNQAISWYMKAAAQGNVDAQQTLKKLGFHYP